jgi:competence protein ComEC
MRSGSRTAAQQGARAVALALAAVIALVGVVAVNRPDGWLRITVLDVGQGDALLLEGGAGGRILVDSGPDPDRLVALLDSRLPPWDRRLDLLVVTHPHEDHVAGAAHLLGRYRVAQVADAGDPGYGPGWRAYASVLEQSGRTPVRLAAGSRLALDGARIDVLWPLPGHRPPGPDAEGYEINNVSLVFDVRYGERRMLLTGDVEEEVDPELLRAGIAAERVDVLKVAHHGSGTATTDAFVGAVHPRVAIVSAGADNRYGHPNPGTIARLEAAGARVLRTDRDGSVTIATDGRQLSVSATGARAAGAVAPGTAAVSAAATPSAAAPTIGAWWCRIEPRPPPYSPG